LTGYKTFKHGLFCQKPRSIFLGRGFAFSILLT
jgi:hypothetical protein